MFVSGKGEAGADGESHDLPAVHATAIAVAETEFALPALASAGLIDFPRGSCEPDFGVRFRSLPPLFAHFSRDRFAREVADVPTGGRGITRER